MMKRKSIHIHSLLAFLFTFHSSATIKISCEKSMLHKHHHRCSSLKCYEIRHNIFIASFSPHSYLALVCISICELVRVYDGARVCAIFYFCFVQENNRKQMGKCGTALDRMSYRTKVNMMKGMDWWMWPNKNSLWHSKYTVTVKCDCDLEANLD